MPLLYPQYTNVPAATGMFTGAAVAPTLASTAPAVAETAKAGLFGFDPASIAFSLFVNNILGKERLLTETPMTPEEAAKFAGQQRLETALGGVGEGAGEFLLDAIEQARAANVTPEQIAETLNTRGDLVSELIGLTVGSNQPFVNVPTAAERAAAEAATDPLGGSTSSLESDGDLTGDLDTIFDSTASAASTAGTGATVVNTDTEHPWLYEGNGVLRNVFTGEVQTNETGTENLVVGETYSSGTPTEATTRSNDTTDSGNINVILTPSVTGGTTSTVVNTTATGDSDTTVVDGGGGLDTGDVTITNGNGVETTTGTATPKSTDPTLTVGTPTVTPTVTATPALTPTVTPTPTVINGVDGIDGTNGQDGRDGRDGRDGFTGLLALNTIATPLADEIFTNEFKMDYLKPELLGLLDLSRGRRSTGRNT